MNEYDLTIKSEKEKYFAINEEATESCVKDLRVERAEKARKICNTQGIY